MLDSKRWTLVITVTLYDFQRTTLEKLSAKLGPDFNINDEKAVSENLIKVDIYFSRLTYEQMIESPAYPVRVLWRIIF